MAGIFSCFGPRSKPKKKEEPKSASILKAPTKRPTAKDELRPIESQQRSSIDSKQSDLFAVKQFCAKCGE